MAENEEQPEANGSASVSDHTLREYLLCRLSEDERLKLDEQLLVDDRLAEQMLLAESDLIDDYAEGRLGGVEREQFTRSFLVTESRKQKLQFASALQGYAASESAARIPRITKPAKPSWSEGFAALFDFTRPRAWAVAGSFAVLILLVGLVWFAPKLRNETQPLVATREPVPTLSPQTPTEQPQSAPVSPSPSPVTKKPAVTPTPESGLPPTVVGYALISGAMRAGGDMSRIAVPHGEHDIVRFSLTLEGLTEGPYRAELKTAEGQKILVRNQLRANLVKDDLTVILDVPARLLPTGDYQIKLTSQKPDILNQPAGTFYFRALEQ